MAEIPRIVDVQIDVPTISTTTTSTSSGQTDNSDSDIRIEETDYSSFPRTGTIQTPACHCHDTWKLEPSTGCSYGGYNIQFKSSRSIDTVSTIYFGCKFLNYKVLDKHTVEISNIPPKGDGPNEVVVILLTSNYISMAEPFKYVMEDVKKEVQIPLDLRNSDELVPDLASEGELILLSAETVDSEGMYL
jgi:hypothetical protein